LEGIFILRVISGVAKGFKLKVTKGLKTRPTTDRVKETVFNIIRNGIQDAKFLDLFAGSGSLGIESLSRGADRGYFIDKSPDCIGIIKENLNFTKLAESAQVYCSDYRIALKKIAEKNEQFDLIFIDPPYNMGFVADSVRLIEEYDILKQDGTIIIERSKTESVNPKHLRTVRESSFGETTITLLKK
jgi:16S rRNA (guanine(966)-N(2))-methyltransferase RsmD